MDEFGSHCIGYRKHFEDEGYIIMAAVGYNMHGKYKFAYNWVIDFSGWSC